MYERYALRYAAVFSMACVHSAGRVGFYWIWSSVFSLIQSVALYSYFTPKRIEEINVKLKEKNKNKKPGLMQRMMDQQNELMRQQEAAKNGGRVDYDADTEGMSRSKAENM